MHMHGEMLTHLSAWHSRVTLQQKITTFLAAARTQT
jgi:hypothetical protein